MASTSRDRILRGALWSAAALNALGAIIFALPVLGQASPLLPMAVPPYVAAQIGFTIALFAGVYAWLALQPQFHRTLILVGGRGWPAADGDRGCIGERRAPTVGAEWSSAFTRTQAEEGRVPHATTLPEAPACAWLLPNASRMWGCFRST